MIVVDGGEGIPKTLREGLPGPFPDSLALEKAVQEGITRNPDVGRGNGLYGSLEIARVSDGHMHIHAGYARLDYEQDQLTLADDRIPFNGSLVIVCLDYSSPGALAQARKFGGEQHRPFDVIEGQYERDREEILSLDVREETTSNGVTGSRPKPRRDRAKQTTRSLEK